MSPDFMKTSNSVLYLFSTHGTFVSSFYLYFWTFSSLVEQSPHKRKVIGSIPIRSINKKGWLYVRV